MPGEFSPPVQLWKRAQELKLMTLALSLSLPALMDPTVPVLQWTLAKAGLPPDGDMPVNLGQANSNESLPFSMREILTKVTTLEGEALGHDLMSVGLILGAVRMGDLIVSRGYMRRDVPLLQFARHFRNACAHGDRWHFFNGEPRYPARVRDLALTAELQGQRATWTTVHPRLYVEFLDDVGAYFLQLAVQEAVDTVQVSHLGQSFEVVKRALAEQIERAGLSGDQDWIDTPARVIARGQRYVVRVHATPPRE